MGTLAGSSVLPQSLVQHTACVRLMRTSSHKCRAHRLPSRMRCVAAAPSTMPSRPRPGEKKGFVEEMRIVAMKLHTREQAPKEGEKEAKEQAEQSVKQWQPSREGYLRFLTESKAVYETLESIVAEAHHPDYARFQNTGLERSAVLAEDIAWMQQEYGLPPLELLEDGPGRAYSKLLCGLADKDPPAFLCHFYNIYFAHTAGGRMIGAKVASMILDSRELNFYKYEGDYKPLLEGVRQQLNETAEGWTREEKDRCLDETQMSFRYSNGLLRCIFE